MTCLASQYRARGGSEDDGGHQQQKLWRAEESPPEVGIVHLKLSSRSRPAWLAAPLSEL
jgi:hypothetical protein